MPKTVLTPRLQRKKDEKKDGDPIRELAEYLRQNFEWKSKSAMIGFCNGSKVHIPKLKGTMNFLSYQQSIANEFTLPLEESISLFFSSRLIISAPSFWLSGHHLMYHYFQNGGTMDRLEKYCSLLRAGASRRKKEKVEIAVGNQAVSFPEGSYGALMNSLPRPQIVNISPCAIFQPTIRAKIPENRGLPPKVCISYDGLAPLDELDSPLVVPLTPKILIEIDGSIAMNPAFITCAKRTESIFKKAHLAEK